MSTVRESPRLGAAVATTPRPCYPFSTNVCDRPGCTCRAERAASEKTLAERRAAAERATDDKAIGQIVRDAGVPSPQAQSLLDRQRQRTLTELDKAIEFLQLAKRIVSRVDVRLLKNPGDAGPLSSIVFNAQALATDATLYRAGSAGNLKRLAIKCELAPELLVGTSLTNITEADEAVEKSAAWAEHYLGDGAEAKVDHLKADLLDVDEPKTDATDGD